MITGFNHTSFTVADLDRTVRFWTEALGFRAASVSERSGDWQGRLTGVPQARLPFVIATEERHLAARFGESWTRYAARSARIIPGIW